jgi:hypothetical protein
MAEFRVTFGQKYRSEPHPSWAGAHPDGWVTIEAWDYATARARAVAGFGTAWCDLYPADAHPSTDSDLYPLGELARITDAGDWVEADR